MSSELPTNQESASAFVRAATAALADVDSLELQGTDREIVLRSALEFYLGSHPVAPQHAVAGVNAGAAASGAPVAPLAPVAATESSTPSDHPLNRIAAKLGIEREIVDVVYDWQDDELSILLSPKCVSTGKAQAARELAQIVSAGRQAAGLEEWTAANVVRDVVHEYGRFDSGNFASSLTALDHNICVFRGKGQQRQIKITRPGYDAVGELLQRMTSGGAA